MSDDAVPVDVLKDQGCCCGSGCENCPYKPAHEAGAVEIDEEFCAYKTTHPAATRDGYERDKAAGTLAP